MKENLEVKLKKLLKEIEKEYNENKYITKKSAVYEEIFFNTLKEISYENYDKFKEYFDKYNKMRDQNEK